MLSTEYERKQLLSEDKYNLLFATLSKDASCNEVLQINYYFDSSDFILYAKGETLRIRQKSGKLSLERKFNKRISSDGIRICDEKDMPMSNLPFLIKSDGIEYRYIGDLVTLRKNFEFENSLVSLDINYYLGKVDYEIEIESYKSISVPKSIIEIVKFENRQIGKYSRFIEKLRQPNLQHKL
jgi:uncharacterized protein YjbK